MKALLASLLAALFALAALSSFAAAPMGDTSAPTSLANDEEKDKDKDGGKKSDG